MHITIPPQKDSAQRGFALIATISVMALLLLIALGVISLSSIVSRSESTERDIEQARANARIGLMIAIGQLQEEIGPDQRITASASILGTKAGANGIEGVESPHYLGVWESWNTWLTDEKTITNDDGSTSTINIQKTYDLPGRDTGSPDDTGSTKLFRRWLVSGADDLTKKMAFASASLPTDIDTTTLVGAYDVGSTENGIVKAPIVAIDGDTGKPTGGYAWWVGDQSQKARVNLADRHNESEALQLSQASSNSLGRPLIEGFDFTNSETFFQDIDTSKEGIAKWVDYLTLYAALGEAPDSSKNLPFHSLTTDSLGLMTDVRFGGIKKDLNTAFEHDSVPTEFGRTNLFDENIEFDTPVRPMTGEIAKISPENPYIAPLSWRQMHQYYRVYREFTDNSKGRYLQWQGGTPTSRRFMMGVVKGREYSNPDTMGYARQPVLLRAYWVVCLRTVAGEDNPYRFVAVPVVYLWNPYNVPLRVEENGTYFTVGLNHATNVKFTVYGDTSTQTIRYNQSKSGYQQSLGRNGEPIFYKPGEIRVFTVTNFNPGGQDFDLTPGYVPITDNSAARGLEYTIPMSPQNQSPSISIAFDDFNAKYSPAYFNGNTASSISSIHGQRGVDFGSLDENEDPIATGSSFNYGITSIAWLSDGSNGTPDERYTEIIKDSGTDRVSFPPETTPGMRPVAVIGLTAKDPEGLIYDGVNDGYAADYRNRAWLHAPPTNFSNYLINPQELNRADSPWQLYFTPATGNSVSNYIQTDGNNAFYGESFGTSGAERVVALELPTSPITNLAGFAGMRMTSARAHVNTLSYADNFKFAAHNGGNFGPAIGNAYAIPMIPGDQIYHNNPIGMDRGHVQSGDNSTGINAFNDYWDHLFLTNEALWDSYFMSSIVPESTEGNTDTTLDKVVEEFFDNERALANANYIPLPQGKTTAELTDIATSSDGWKSIGSYIGVNGAFNVNSTDQEAWVAFLRSIRDRKIPYLKEDGTTGIITAKKDDGVVLSRFRLANSDNHGSLPVSPGAWDGVIYVTDSEIVTLAREIVRQVIERGPFLNMSEFINRRLSTDGHGVTGVIQAAIDWDESRTGYDGTVRPGGSIINSHYKEGSNYIRDPDIDYPNKKAAIGSRHAGAPGYLMQSDLLQAIGSSLTVRGDTFVVRAYGEAKDSTGTKVIARAWCEAIVQRVPQYVDSTNTPETKATNEDGTENTALTDINRKYGRQIKVVSFRWLSPSEINQ